YDLSIPDWAAITTVAEWLQIFRVATTQMSTTSVPMLSATHGVFLGLQKRLQAQLRAIPAGTSPELADALTAAHRKLSDYYYKYDESPFYI
ncbi:hypothetical protein GGX14DRAFT_307899, partial [Mycena pura]